MLRSPAASPPWTAEVVADARQLDAASPFTELR
jgi:hypothetical protein